MSEDLRARVRAAISATAIERGLDPDRNERATVPLDAATDAVLAVLDETFPPMLAIGPAPEPTPEQVAQWQAAWDEHPREVARFGESDG